MVSGTAVVAFGLLAGLGQADRGARAGGYWSGGRWEDGSGGRGDDNGNSTFGNEENGFGFGSLQSFNRANAILIAHGVLASAVWVVLVPWAALLLRLNIKSPMVLKLHAIFQVLSLLVFVIAAGLGVWLAQQMSDFGIWDDAHLRLGVLVVGAAIVQPFLGAWHHSKFKKRSAAAAAGSATKAPGRTVPGWIHLIMGRSFIVLGIVTGGLGIRLTSFSPFRTDSQTRTSGIIYGVVAGLMVALYVVVVVLFEARRKRAARTMPQALPMKESPTNGVTQSSARSQVSRQNNSVQGATTADAGVRYS